MKKKQAGQQARPVTVRNTMARHPLLSKSGVHDKTNKAKRRASRVSLKKTWFERGAVKSAPGQSHVLQRVDQNPVQCVLCV